MVTIIAGSRGEQRITGKDWRGYNIYTPYVGNARLCVELIDTAVRLSGFDITEVPCGMAAGIDLTGRDWANEHRIKVTPFYADWKNNGRAAGMIRNRQMGEYAARYNGGCVLIWDGVSAGTAAMKRIAEELGLKLYVMRV